jgi:hypothetical protein
VLDTGFELVKELGADPAKLVLGGGGLELEPAVS